MITQRHTETRLAYLLRVAIHHIREHAADCVTEYDGTDCDGSCLAEELQHELESLPSSPEKMDGHHWPLPWYNEVESGCFGTILAANGEPVAQVQPLSPALEKDIVRRNEWRNVIARKICQAMNGAATPPPDEKIFVASSAAEFMAEHMPDDPLPELCPTCSRELRFRPSSHPHKRIEVDCQNCGVHAVGEDRGFAVQTLHRFIASKKP